MPMALQGLCGYKSKSIFKVDGSSESSSSVLTLTRCSHGWQATMPTTVCNAASQGDSIGTQWRR